MHWKIYTDGACQVPTRKGGWGVLFIKDDVIEYEISGNTTDTTSNRMELFSVIKSYDFLKENNISFESLEIFTDSTYVQKGASKYLDNWIRNNWLLSNKAPVKNQDLWQCIFTIKQQVPQLHWTWVKGHDKDVFNNRADYLATSSLAKITSL